jgi:hypothetical protein
VDKLPENSPIFQGGGMGIYAAFMHKNAKVDYDMVASSAVKTSPNTSLRAIQIEPVSQRWFRFVKGA